MHEPSQLLCVGSDFTRQGGRGQRKWAVWYRRLRCPVCNREFVRLRNPLRGRRVRCVGRDSLQVTKKSDSESAGDPCPPTS